VIFYFSLLNHYFCPAFGFEGVFAQQGYTVQVCDPGKPGQAATGDSTRYQSPVNKSANELKGKSGVNPALSP
jgi:hypothetical protein